MPKIEDDAKKSSGYKLEKMVISVTWEYRFFHGRTHNTLNLFVVMMEMEMSCIVNVVTAFVPCIVNVLTAFVSA